eukprot:jgi/Botrbrau1/17913/Bobra.50_1s0014.1
MRCRWIVLLVSSLSFKTIGAQLVKSWAKAFIQPSALALRCAADGSTVVAGTESPTCYSGSTLNNPVSRTACNALNTAQRWEVTRDLSAGTFTIASKASGFCWTANNPGDPGASSLIVTACDPARSIASGELFNLVFSSFVPGCSPQSGAAYYQIQALLPGGSRRCLSQQPGIPTATFSQCSGNLADSTQSFLIWTGPQPVAVYTDRYGISRTGLNGRESTITPQLLRSSKFGKVGRYPVVGAIYAHPIIAPNVRIGDASISGVITATQKNYVYFFDADQVTDNPTPIWVRGPLGIPLTPADVGFFSATSQLISCTLIRDSIGITSTPVIDPSTNTLYVVALSKPTTAQITGQPDAASHTLYSLDLATGANKYAPMVISGSTTLNGETVFFKPTYQNQRAGLAFTNGNVIVAFGAHCDFNLYSGWVFALNPALQKITGVWRSVKQVGSDGGGVWTSGTAPMIDPSDNIYVTTGNGLDEPQNGYYGNSVVKLSQPPGSATQPWRVVDYFMPSDNPQINDEDFGTGMPTLFNIGSLSLIAMGGKVGKAWIQDITNLQQKSTPSLPVDFWSGLHIELLPVRSCK